MTNAEAIRCLSVHSSTNGSGLCTDKQHYEAKQVAIQALEQTTWIPVSEGLPEERYAVLVWCPERKNTYCAYLEEGQWWIFGAYFEKVKLEVTAWMPLPLPWEGE